MHGNVEEIACPTVLYWLWFSSAVAAAKYFLHRYDHETLTVLICMLRTVSVLRCLTLHLVDQRMDDDEASKTLTPIDITTGM